MLLARAAGAGIVAADLWRGTAKLLHGGEVVVMVVVAVGTVDMAVIVVIVVAIGAVDVLGGGGWLAVGSVGGHGTRSLIGTSISIEP